MKDFDNTPATPTNRPGLSKIVYRISNYNQFFERLLSRLSDGESDETVPLVRLTTRSPDDAAIALLDAWSIMADVLTFYQERIANEGYLRTAIERRSLLELTRAIGYELNPGVAASTHLSFTVEEAPNSPTVTQIVKGTEVSSVPEGDELPQTFETIEDFTAYVQWNAIKPRLTRPQTIIPGITTELYITGIDTQLSAGDYLLLRDEQEPDSKYLLELSSVESNSDENYTLVTFSSFPVLDNPEPPLRQPQVFAFRGEASFFGSNAPQWNTLSVEEQRKAIEADQNKDDGEEQRKSIEADQNKDDGEENKTNGTKIDGGVITIKQDDNQWTSKLVGKDLPNLDISDLVINREGDVFVSIPSRGIFRLFSGSDRWVEINDGLSNINIQTLYVNDRGHLFAGGSNGTAGGGAFRSKDNGNSWTEIATGTIGVEPHSDTTNNPGQFIAVNTSISNTVVRSFLTYEENRTVYIFVGTDNGVYYSIDRGENWHSFNNDLLSDDTVVHSLVSYGKNIKDSEFYIYKKQLSKVNSSVVNLSVDNQDKTQIIVEENQEVTIEKDDIIEIKKQFRVVKDVSDNIIELDYPLSKTVENNNELIIYKRKKEKGTGKISVSGEDKKEVIGDGNTKFIREINLGDIIEVKRVEAEDVEPENVEPENVEVENVEAEDIQAENVEPENVEVQSYFRIVKKIDDNNKLYVTSGFVSIIAGTDNGVFELNLKNITYNNSNWTDKNTGIDIDDQDTSVLIEHNKTELYLGSKNGKIYKFPKNDTTDSWVKIGEINHEDQPQKITALSLSIEEETKKLVIGTAKQGLYYKDKNLDDILEKIKPICDNQDPKNQEFPTAITALKAYQDKFFVGTRFTEIRETEWPKFGIEAGTNKIQLDTLYPQILKESLIILVNDNDLEKPRFADHKVNKISKSAENRFNLSLEITEIESNKPIENSKNFNRRTSKIFIESEQLELAVEQLTIVAKGEDIFLDPIQQETFIEPVQEEFSKTKTIFLSQFIENLKRDQTVIISGQHMTARIEDIGGIFCRVNKQNEEKTEENNEEEDKIVWTSQNEGLTNSQVTSLVINSKETKKESLVGTTQGLFKSRDNSNLWEPIDDWKEIENKLENKEIQALLINQKDIIFVGTAEGLFKSKKGLESQEFNWQQIKEETGLLYDNILTLIEIPLTEKDKKGIILVGTIEGGLFQSKDDGERWTSLGLYNTNVRTIAIQKKQFNNYNLFVGTTQKGIFRSLDQGNSWERIIETREGKGRVSSNNNQVIWRGNNFDQQIEAGDTINAAGQTRTISNIVITDNDGSEAILSIDNPFKPNLINQSFTINTGLTNRSITAVAVAARIVEATISIDNNIITIENNTITDPEEKLTNALIDLLKVGDTLTIDISNKTQTQIITQISERSITVEKPFTGSINNKLKMIIINQNIIFAGTSGSGVFRSQDNGDRWQEINVNLTDLEIRCLTVDDQGNIWVGTAKDGVFKSSNNGDIWIPFNDNLANIDVQTIIVDNDTIFVGGIGILINPDGLQTTPVQRQDRVEIITSPIPMSNQGRTSLYQRWKVRDKDGFEGSLTTALPSQPLTLNHLTLLPAPEESEIVSEIATIAIPPQDQQLPLLVLTDPLQNAYDPETVTIYGNVIGATHGATVEEVLGSGDGNASNQTFTLQEPPLTYISDATPSGRKSTLEVRINDVLWQETFSLHNLNPHDPNYIVRIQDNGTTNVIFGDGKKGSRLPTGLENITATYRQGIGSDGNVGANSLTILNNTPPAIADVINPLKATGGTDRETQGQVRQKAPSSVRILDRIVSLEDFEDFARSFTGIGKAIATPLWQQGIEIVHLTIATDTGETVSETSRLYTSLVEAIDGAKDPRQSVIIDSYQAIKFNVEAKLILDPKYEAKPVTLNVRNALIETFKFSKRNFGQPVTTAEAITAMQKVKGVTAVDLDALYQSDRSKVLNTSLSASLAYYDPRTNQIRPAQLLLINIAGIQLTST